VLASFICLLSFSFLCLQFQFSFPTVVALHFVFFIWGFAFISFPLKYFKFSCFLGFIFVLRYCCRAFYLEFSHFGFFSVDFFTTTWVLVSCMLPIVSFWSFGILFGDLYVWLLLHVFGWCCWFVVHKGQYFWLFVVFPLMRWSTKEHPRGKFVSFFFFFAWFFLVTLFFQNWYAWCCLVFDSQMFEVSYNDHGWNILWYLCMFACYLFLTSLSCLMLFGGCFGCHLGRVKKIA